MSTLLNRCVAVVAAALALLIAGATTAGAAHATLAPTMHSDRPADATGPVVDDFTLTSLPTGLGDRVSEHAYTWEDIRFETMAWESRRPTGGYQVDLNAHVLRGGELATEQALHQFLARYLEREQADWQLEQVTIGASAGRLGDTDVFWLVRPGVAVWISARATGFDRADLLATARGVQERG